MKKIPKTLSGKLNRLEACTIAIKWGNGQDPQEAWAVCNRSDWMLWLIGRLAPKQKAAKKAWDARISLLTCEVARTMLQYVPSNELRPLKAIEMAERWHNGEASEADCIIASNKSYAIYSNDIRLFKRITNVGIAGYVAYIAAHYAVNTICINKAIHAIIVAGIAIEETEETYCRMIRKRFPWRSIRARAIAAEILEP